MRFMLKRALSNEWLDLDMPVRDYSVTRTLSGPGDITVTLPAEYRSYRGQDGHPFLDEWRTLLIAVEDSGDVSVALLDDVVLKGEEVEASGGGVSMQTKGIPWSDKVREYLEVDPVVVIRDVWDHINSYSNHIPVRVSGANASGGIVGKKEDPEHRKWRLSVESLEGKKKSLESGVKGAELSIAGAAKSLFKAAGMSTVGEVKVQKGGGYSDTKNVIWLDSDAGYQAHVYKYFPQRKVRMSNGKLRTQAAGHEWVKVGGLQSRATAYVGATATRKATQEQLVKTRDSLEVARDKLRIEADKGGAANPYTLAWYATHDLSAVIEDMCLAGPVEWVEHAHLDQDTQELSFSIELGAPRFGARRNTIDSPRFELGINVHVQPDVEDADPYTDVKIYGAGQGSKVLHEYRVLRRPGLVRRVRIITNKDAAAREQVRRLADAEAVRLDRQQAVNIRNLVVEDHPYAQPGTYGLGDEILVTGEMADGTDLEVWVRIFEITTTPDGRRQLTVEAV